jgi:glycogen debranching enzyme
LRACGKAARTAPRPAQSVANRLRKKAAALFKRFNEVFWDEKSGFYAFALDGDKKKVLSVASNVGQCLWSGIIAPKRAAAVADSLNVMRYSTFNRSPGKLRSICQSE